ncbi:Crp/Fnr family transcriptional regulator [Martelella sp. AMO21009]
MSILNVRHAQLRCAHCPAREGGPCGVAGPHGQDLLFRNSISACFNKGETILPQEEVGERIGIILGGTVKLINIAADGRETVIALLGRNDLIGNPVVARSRFSYEAASAVTVCMITRSALIQGMREDSDIAVRLVELISRQAEEVEEWLTLFNCRTTLQRLAGYLHALARVRSRRSLNTEAIVLDIPICRKDLATFLGTTPETLSRNFQRLARQHILTLVSGSRVVVTDFSALGRVAGRSGDELRSILGFAADAVSERGQSLVDRKQSEVIARRPAVAGTRF